MHMKMLSSHSLYTLFSFLFLSNNFLGANALTSYANDFVDPDVILAGNFSPNTTGAQRTVVSWARELNAKGPWTVMNKAVTPPTGSKHDYMSWAPYWWPDCSNAGNTTELAPEQIWTTCTYRSRDGQFNPDGRLINDVGAFQDLSDAVLYNAIAWKIQGDPSSDWSRNVVNFVRTWFLDEETRMNPNLEYGQMQRGPTGQTGSHTGVLDLKGMSKIVSGILILRKGQSPDWTTELDDAMNSWAREYITWLETAKIAIEEALATNNHGTFYYNQLAALKVLVNDNKGAENVTDTYFNTLYMAQIESTGEQPLEAARTRPYHYRAYNLAAMITNARLAKYANPSSNIWNKTTTQGATIKTALDFAMTISPVTSRETSYAAELYPNIAAVASIYGDADDKYVQFLGQADPAYANEAYFIWNQPLKGGSDSAGAPSGAKADTTSTGKSPKSSTTSENGGAGLQRGWVGLVIGVLGAGLVLAL